MKWDRTKFFKIGESFAVRIPAGVLADKDYPLDRSTRDYVIAIKEIDGKKGLFIFNAED